MAQAAVAAAAWIGATTLCVLWLSRRAEALLAAVREQGPPGLWEELGAPGSVREAVADPAGRWRRFVREKAYRSRCDPLLSARIEDFARHTSVALVGMAASGVAVLWWVRPWLDLP